ncbi:heavy-metal-associated domain-containing protein [Nonomuraea sp. NPDC049784]|uniref:heavy-metal-associated domain-containing protein n=1 Tax=Nonomuraea sp. NPDC049784 TaxID=3154361 RepID=UPI0033CCE217
MTPGDMKDRRTAVLDVSGLQWASEQHVVRAALSRRPGVIEAEVNPVGQTATVVFDPRATSMAELRRWVQECGYHCAGQSVPSHVCDPMAEPWLQRGGRKVGPRYRAPSRTDGPDPRSSTAAPEHSTCRCPGSRRSPSNTVSPSPTSLWAISTSFA